MPSALVEYIIALYIMIPSPTPGVCSSTSSPLFLINSETVTRKHLLFSLRRFSPVLASRSRTVARAHSRPSSPNLALPFSLHLCLFPPSTSPLRRHHTYRSHLTYSSVGPHLPLTISRSPGAIVSSPTSRATGSSTASDSYPHK